MTTSNQILPVRDFPNYRICIDGTVLSLPNKTYSGTRVLKGKRDYNGYKIVTLYRDGKSKTLKVHRLLAQHFIPNPENKPQVNHIDENKKNNAITNLEWATCKENINHSIPSRYKRLGYWPTTKLTPSDRQHVLDIFASGEMNGKQIAKLFGVSDVLVYKVRTAGR